MQWYLIIIHNNDLTLDIMVLSSKLHVVAISHVINELQHPEINNNIIYIYIYIYIYTNEDKPTCIFNQYNCGVDTKSCENFYNNVNKLLQFAFLTILHLLATLMQSVGFNFQKQITCDSISDQCASFQQAFRWSFWRNTNQLTLININT